MKLNKLLEKRLSVKQKTYSKTLKDTFTVEEYKFFVDCIIKDSKKGLNITSLTQKYLISKGTVRTILTNANYKWINKHHALRIRETLFQNIETEEDAYWLGFIYADGYISDTGKFEISLCYKDYEHLLKFAKYCKFDEDKVIQKQKVGEKYFRCRISFATGKLKQRFFDLGIKPRKSLTLVYPNIKPELEKHFIRGYFDGDGSLSNSPIKKRCYHAWQMSFVGTENFLKGINKFFNKNNKILFNKGKSCSFSYGGNIQVKRLTDILYKDSKIYLKRKYDLYCRLTEQFVR
jgi:hypothetical protein